MTFIASAPAQATYYAQAPPRYSSTWRQGQRTMMAAPGLVQAVFQQPGSIGMKFEEWSGEQDGQTHQWLKVTGITPATITKHVRHPELPWPTSLLHEATSRLIHEGRLRDALAAAAREQMATWLAKPTGPLRTWCRQTRPRLLAACALLRASRDAAAAAAAAGGTVTDAIGTVSAAAAAAAVGVGGSEEAAAQAVEAALAALPSAA